MRIEGSHADPGPAALQARQDSCEQANLFDHGFWLQVSKNVTQCHMERNVHNAHAMAEKHHAVMSRSGPFGQDLRVPG